MATTSSPFQSEICYKSQNARERVLYCDSRSYFWILLYLLNIFLSFPASNSVYTQGDCDAEWLKDTTFFSEMRLLTRVTRLLGRLCHQCSYSLLCGFSLHSSHTPTLSTFVVSLLLSFSVASKVRNTVFQQSNAFAFWKKLAGINMGLQNRTREKTWLLAIFSIHSCILEQNHVPQPMWRHRRKWHFLDLLSFQDPIHLSLLTYVFTLKQVSCRLIFLSNLTVFTFELDV